MRFNLRSIFRAVIVYAIATAAAAVAGTAVTVPLGPQPGVVITMVWISAAASTGFTTLLILDGWLTGRKTKAGRR